MIVAAAVEREDNPETAPSNCVAPVFIVSELEAPVIASAKCTVSLAAELVIVVFPASVTALVKERESELKVPFRVAVPFVTVRSAVVKVPARFTVPLVLISVSLLKVAPSAKERFPAPATSDQVVISGVPENVVAVPLMIVNESMLQLPLTVRLPPFLFSIIFV